MDAIPGAVDVRDEEFPYIHESDREAVLAISADTGIAAPRLKLFFNLSCLVLVRLCMKAAALERYPVC